jgi:cobyrinic acid a,c-diamide synthase
MLESVRLYGEAGGFIFGECGGLMYLTEYVEECPMVGLFPGKCTLTDSLQRFGYIDLTLDQDCFLGKAGTRFTGHEFHKSITTVNLPTVFSIKKTMGEARWNCGFRYKNIIAGYPHVNFLGNIKLLQNMLDSVARQK